MPRGRHPTPTKILQLHGSRYADHRTPGPEPAKIAPPMPDWLDEDGKRLWDELLPELVRLGVVTCVDGVAFGVFCEVTATYAKLLQEEKTRWTARELADCRATILRYASEFGLTALARNRLRVAKPAKEEAKPKARFFAGAG